MPGRPGVNQLRIKTTMVVTHEQMEQIKAIAAACEANAALEISRAEGYSVAQTEANLILQSSCISVKAKPQCDAAGKRVGNKGWFHRICF